MPRVRHCPCSVDGCKRSRHARNLCAMHYRKLLRHGDPRAGRQTPNGAPEAFLADAVDASIDECIMWPFATDVEGYALIGRRNAHAVVCERAHGPRPDGMQVCHSCVDRRRCINPRHLRWDTPRANVADRERDRKVKGLRGNRAKLTPTEVEEIRWSYTRGLATQQVLAEIYGVSQSSISKIVRTVKV